MTEIRAGDYALLLTITKVRKEREYRGVAVRQFAPLARVHAASGSGRNAVHPNLALFLRTGPGLRNKPMIRSLIEFAAVLIRLLVCVRK